jgi:tRNA pseudouridine38-40 synthase
MRVLINFQYDGTNFCGFQIQPQKRTVEGTLNEILSKVLNQKIKVVGSGRTDAGVHAISQTAHFDCDTSIPITSLPFAVNKFLPNDLKILSAKLVSNDFHARYSIKKKTYLYKCYFSNIDLPLYNNRAYRIEYKLNIKDIKKASEFLVGTHDFTTFKSAKSDMKNCVRTIYSINIINNENELDFEICGNGFMYNMVRIIVGTLLDIGRGRFKSEDIEKMLNDKNRISAGVTLPSFGLYLKSIEY